MIVEARARAGNWVTSSVMWAVVCQLVSDTPCSFHEALPQRPLPFTQEGVNVKYRLGHFAMTLR